VFERLRPVPESYVVDSGDTLSNIAWRYGLDYHEIAAWNQLKSPNLIYPGQRLWLRPAPIGSDNVAFRSSSMSSAESTVFKSNPMPTLQSTVKPQAVPARSISSSNPPLTTQPPSQPVNLNETPIAQRVVGDVVWRWPTLGSIVRDYEPDVPGGKGIQISGQLGQLVRAASPGQVVYSGSGLPGYGRLIILKHSDDLLSAYGYLGKIFVEEGDKVQLGQSIAELGASNENRPILHFEIRRDGKPVNPLDFLPS
jgi:lipoprotein NlpD